MEESAWGTLQISTHELLSMPYHHFHVNIYEKKRNPSDSSVAMYYFSPVVLLDHQSAKCRRNETNDRVELTFKIDFWNQGLHDDVYQYLKDNIDPEMKKYQVAIIPFEKVILTSSEILTKYRLTHNWISYQGHQYCNFVLICSSLEIGQHLVQQMKYDPQQFANLRLQFSLNSQTSRRKETVIRTEHILNGQLFAQINQRCSTMNSILLTADDAKRLISESTSNVIAETFDDTEIVSENSVSPLYKMLENLIITGTETIQDMEKFSWDSVFWQNENSRPDKIVKTVNHFFDKSDSETQDKLKKTFQSGTKNKKEKKIGLGNWDWVLKLGNISFNNEQSSEKSRCKDQTREDIIKFLEESKKEIEWNGEKFVPKSLDLKRINLSQIRQKQQLQDCKIFVTYSNSLLSLAMNIDESYRTPYSTGSYYVSEQLFHSLQTKVESLERNVIQQIAQIQGHQEMASLVYFDVYRNFVVALKDESDILSYQGCRINKGEAMNLSRGKFTAPLKGYYIFSFESEVSSTRSSWLLREFQLCKQFTDEHEQVIKKCPVKWFNQYSCPWYVSMFSLVTLNVGEKVFIKKIYGQHTDNQAIDQIISRRGVIQEMTSNFIGGLLWAFPNKLIDY